jgi:hypothetical protein
MKTPGLLSLEQPLSIVQSPYCVTHIPIRPQSSPRAPRSLCDQLPRSAIKSSREGNTKKPRRRATPTSWPLTASCASQSPALYIAQEIPGERFKISVSSLASGYVAFLESHVVATMFAPPPTATLSRAEIQARRAQLQAKRASSGTSISSASELQKTESNTEVAKQEKKKASRFSANKKDVEEIRENDKEEWKFKKKLSRKGKSIGEGGSGTSLPATLLPPPPAPPGPPSLRTTGSDAGSFAESVQEGSSFANSSTERKGKAVPPKRPARPSGEMFLSPPASSSMSEPFPRALTPESFGGSSFRSATSSPAMQSPYQAPPPVPGAFPTMTVPSLKANSPKPPPLPSPPLMAGPPSLPGPASPPPSTPPPPVPEKSPLRQQRAARPNSNPVKSTGPGPIASKKQHSMSTDAALSTAMAELRMAMKDPISIGQAAGEQHQRPPHRSRAATVPANQISVLTGIKPLQVRKPLKSPVMSSSRSGTGSSKTTAGGNKVAVTSPTRSIVAVSRSQRVAKQGIRRQTVTHHRRGSSSSSAKTGAQKQAESPTQIVTPKPRRAKDETMTMLQTSGFSPSTPGTVSPSKGLSVKTQIMSATRFIDKDLPDAPNSIAPTPTEMYQPSRNSLILARKSRSSTTSTQRSPLSAVTDTDAESDRSPMAQPSLEPAPASDDLSPHRLTTILEYKALSESSPPASGTVTPTATQIHLRGGSVVTVTPPEMTAWQRSLYLQGPIRLPKPVILPRKDSVASMEPFQEAIDLVYQNALYISRRRSDDAIVDDVCEYFDDFGFSDVGFGGDLLAIEQAEGANDDEVGEVDELEDTIERFTTPPGFPPAGEISPIEKSVAKDVVEASMAKPVVVTESIIPLPPVNNEETLRARGIARLSQQSGRSSQGSRSSSYRKETPSISRRTSETLTASVAGESQDGLLPLLPPPEASMLDAVMEASQGEEAEWADEMTPDGDAGRMDWSDDDVEETDVGAS